MEEQRNCKKYKLSIHYSVLCILFLPRGVNEVGEKMGRRDNVMDGDDF